jgi:hypothetical protein
MDGWIDGWMDDWDKQLMDKLSSWITLNYNKAEKLHSVVCLIEQVTQREET